MIPVWTRRVVYAVEVLRLGVDHFTSLPAVYILKNEETQLVSP